MKRREFLKGAAVTASAAGVSTLAAPAIAQGTVEMAIVSTWPRDFPGLGTSAQRAAARIGELSEGRINVTYYAAGEKVGAFDSLDEVASPVDTLTSIFETVPDMARVLVASRQPLPDALLADPEVYKDHKRFSELHDEREKVQAELTPLEEEWARRADEE